jgi:hypothetical protein
MSISRARLVAAGVLVATVTALGFGSAAHAAAAPVKPAASPVSLGTPPSVDPSAATTSAPTADKYARKGKPPTPGQITPLAATFFYGTSYQAASADGMYAYMSVAKPFLSGADFHTLAELAAESSDARQIIEVGWTVDKALYGDVNPRLFVFHWVDGVPICYNGCGFVQYSSTVRPGGQLGIGEHFFAIQHFQGNWWIQLNSEWVGYFPDSLWGGRYTRTGLSQWFGEVAAGSGAPCTDMGNGLFASSASAASINTMGFYNGPAVSKSTYNSNSSYYSALSTSSTSMRYGGSGAC